MRTLLLVLLGVFTFAYVANTAPVPHKFQVAKIRDLLNALSKESDIAESPPYDDSQSDDEDDDDSDEGAEDTPQIADERRPDSLEQVSKIQADLQDLLNVLSMSDVDESSDEQDEDEDDDNDEGAGDLMTAQAEDKYYDDGQDSQRLALVQAMRSALFENLSAKPRAHSLDYMMKVARLPVDSEDLDEYNKYPEDDDQANSQDESDLDDDDYDTAEVAKAFMSSLPEKVKTQFLTAILARAAPHLMKV